MQNKFKFALVAFFAVIIFSGALKVEASSANPQTNSFPCSGSNPFVAFPSATDRNSYSGGAQILIDTSASAVGGSGVETIAPDQPSQGSCSISASMSMSVGTSNSTIYYSGARTTTTGLIAPCVAGNYNISLNGVAQYGGNSYSTNNGVPGSLPITVTSNCAQPANVTVNSISNGGTCPIGTSWTASGTGLSQSGSDDGSFTFLPQTGGTNVSMSATAPAGWIYDFATPASQLMYQGGLYSFVLSCHAIAANPDLTSTNIYTDVSPSSGQPAYFIAQVANLSSTAAAGSSHTLFQHSMGPNGSGLSSNFWTVATPSLNASQTTTVTSPSTYTLYTSSPFTYSIRACADTSGEVVESDEGNNCGPWQNITVTGDPSYTGISPCGYTGNGSCGVPTPTITVTASPASISSGGSSTITWSTTNMSSCNAVWWSGSSATSGSTVVSPISSTTYSKTCVDSVGNSYTGSALVTVNPVASVTLTPASQTITSGNSATLTWSGTNVSSCSGTSPANWTASSATSGNKSVSPTSNTTYTISCVSSVGGADPVASATVSVTGSGPDLTAGASSPTTAVVSTNTNLTASISNIGGSSTGGGFSNFFQVATASGGGGTITDLVSSAVSPLASGASITATYSNYQFVSAGTYSVRACADKTSSGNVGVIAETNEANNCGVWTDVVVSNGGGSFDYSLSNSGNVTVVKGGTPQPGQNTISVTLVSGTTQPVTLTVSGAPAGVSSSASTCFPANPSCTSTVTFSVPSTAPTGTFPITVTGSPLNKTTSFKLIIVPSTAIVVTCTPSPATTLVGNPVTWTSNVSGGSGTYTSYVWSGAGIPTSPAPSTASFSVAYSTVGLKTAQLTVTDSLGNTGSCTPAGTVQINFNPQFKEF